MSTQTKWNKLNWKVGYTVVWCARDKNERMNEHKWEWERVCMWIWIGIRCPVSPLYKYFYCLLTIACHHPHQPHPPTHCSFPCPFTRVFTRWFDCRWWCFSLQMLSSFISRISRCRPSQILHLSSARTNLLNGGSKGLKLFLYCIQMLFAYVRTGARECARTSVKKYKCVWIETANCG